MSNPQPDHDAAAIGRFEEALFHAVRRLGGAGQAILIAVSGGADSTALMRALVGVRPRLRLTLEVATLDHGLRPEAAAEAQAVATRAAALGLPAHVRTLGLRPGSGLEQRARDARYRALEELRRQRAFALVATAHTASDQAETVLMRLGRGAAVGGAAGIHAQRPHLIRPLLGLTRADVLGYLAARAEPWHEDPMNADRQFLRVRVRADVLPAFEAAAGPNVAQHLAAFARVAADDDALLSDLAQAALQRISDGGALDAVALDALALPVRRRVIASWLRGHQLPVDAALLEDVIAAVRAGRNATLPGDQLGVVRDGWLRAEAAPSRNFTLGAGIGAGDAL